MEYFSPTTIMFYTEMRVTISVKYVNIKKRERKRKLNDSNPVLR